MYLRYIYKLHDLHLPADNYTEAGFTMKLYADQLSWTSRTVVADPQFPGIPEWQRKEQLYRQIIHYFDRGKCWEKGIPLCKELAGLYELHLFDYTKLSDILRTQAKFFDNILTQLRPEPEYFRVGFYGLSFPLFVRNKLFVYRGLEYERIGQFTQRIQTEFPSAHILMKNCPPDETILNSEGQYIQICNVKPIPEDNPLFPVGADIPEKVSNFYMVNDVRRFQLDRPVHKGPVDKENEFKSLWIERTTLTISNPLPGILRWFEVIERSVEEVPPVQFACETMAGVNKELRQLLGQYTADSKRNINPFSMRLQGIIDANVMGGIAKYQTAFFMAEFTKQNPEFTDHVLRLKMLTVEQLQVLESALILHGDLAPTGVQPLHRRLKERFGQLKTGLRDLGSLQTHRGRPSLSSTSSIINTPLPPLPTEKKTLHSGGSASTSVSGDIPCGHSSTTYSQLARAAAEEQNLEDEGHYSKPMESSVYLPHPPPIPLRETRPRSVGYGELARTPTRGNNDYSSLPAMRITRDLLEGDSSPTVPRPPKPTHQRSLSKPLSFPCTPPPGSLDGAGSPLRNSWSEASMEEAPPLPPRGQTPDKRNTGLHLDTSSTPPAPPKRLIKKGSSPAINMDAIVDVNFETSDLDGSGGSGDGITGGGSGYDLRDSGYAEFPVAHGLTPTNNFNNLSYEDFELPQSNRCSEMNISPPTLSPRASACAPPPPIPPKSNIMPSSPQNVASSDSLTDLFPEAENSSGLSNLNDHSSNLSSSLLASQIDNYSVPKSQYVPQRTGSPT